MMDWEHCEECGRDFVPVNVELFRLPFSDGVGQAGQVAEARFFAFHWKDRWNQSELCKASGMVVPHQNAIVRNDLQKGEAA